MKAEDSKPISWEEVKEAIRTNSRAESIRHHLKIGNPLINEELQFLNLLFQEEYSKNSSELTAQSIELARKATDLSEKTVIWARALAILTSVLAISALADILLRIFCRV